MKKCIFCNIAAGKEREVNTVWEDDDVICFLPLEMEVFGHLILAPKNHSENIFDIGSGDLLYVSKALKKTSLLLKNKLGADGINILNANGVSAGQSVEHTHFHLMPRFNNDNLDLWPKIKSESYDRDQVIKQLRG